MEPKAGHLVTCTVSGQGQQIRVSATRYIFMCIDPQPEQQVLANIRDDGTVHDGLTLLFKLAEKAANKKPRNNIIQDCRVHVDPAKNACSHTELGLETS